MDYTCRTKTLQSIAKDIAKGRIVLSHKLQRKEGQWNKQQKSDLIDSLLRKYPINPTYSIKESDTLSVIDGVQRLSTVRDYLNDVFALSKTLEPVIVNNEKKEIAGKKFSKLDEETQDAIKNSELQIYELTGCTEKDVREMFRRQNAGKALSNGQLRIVRETDELSSLIFSLTNHPFIKKVVTDTQSKKDLDKDIVREILMLTEKGEGSEPISFRSKDIDAFIDYYNDNIHSDKIETLKAALDELDKAFEENVKIKQTSIPMVCYGMYKVIDGKKDTAKYIAWLKKFVETYDTNEKYLQYCNGGGTASADMVKGRLKYFEDAVKKM
ncbi:MAG: DUF262 domain-containing protein [Lachnospiraceae bacterium]|nr:DUF262 domain-containing protein [Lachnospiraceae bacterium]